MLPARCRDCKLFALEDVLSKNGRVLPHRVGRCLWVSRETWPDSVNIAMNPRPKADRMEPNAGERCRKFIKRERECV